MLAVTFAASSVRAQCCMLGLANVAHAHDGTSQYHTFHICCSGFYTSTLLKLWLAQVEHKVSTLAKDVDLSPGGTEGLSQAEVQQAREQWKEEVGHASGQKPGGGQKH